MGDPSTREQTRTEARPQAELQRPRMWKVLLHNDDFTTMEFVIEVLISVFHHDEPTAFRIMLQVHNEGLGVAGVYPFEIAAVILLVAMVAAIALTLRRHGVVRKAADWTVLRMRLRERQRKGERNENGSQAGHRNPRYQRLFETAVLLQYVSHLIVWNRKDRASVRPGHGPGSDHRVDDGHGISGGVQKRRAFF